MAINVSTGLPDLFTDLIGACLSTYYVLVYRLTMCLLLVASVIDFGFIVL